MENTKASLKKDAVPFIQLVRQRRDLQIWLGCLVGLSVLYFFSTPQVETLSLSLLIGSAAWFIGVEVTKHPHIPAQKSGLSDQDSYSFPETLGGQGKLKLGDEGFPRTPQPSEEGKTLSREDQKASKKRILQKGSTPKRSQRAKLEYHNDLVAQAQRKVAEPAPEEIMVWLVKDAQSAIFQILSDQIEAADLTQSKRRIALTNLKAFKWMNAHASQFESDEALGVSAAPFVNVGPDTCKALCRGQNTAFRKVLEKIGFGAYLVENNIYKTIE